MGKREDCKKQLLTVNLLTFGPLCKNNLTRSKLDFD